MLSTLAPSLRTRRGELLLAALSVLVVLGIVEAALRLAGYEPFASLRDGKGLLLQPSGRAGLEYELVPGSEGQAWGTQVKVNAAGFRDREFPPEKPAGTRRIVVLGDSVAFGYATAAEDVFPKRLEALLAASSKRLEVLNLAVPGYDTAAEVAQLEGFGLRYAPDLVVLAFCWNDLAETSPSLAYIRRTRSYRSPLYRLRLAQLVRVRLDRLLEQRSEPLPLVEAPRQLDPTLEGLRAAFEAELRQQPDLADTPIAALSDVSALGRFREALSRLSSVARSAGTRAVVLVLPALDQGHEALFARGQDIVRSEADRLALPTCVVPEDPSVVFSPALRARADDLLHPNRQGHALIAQSLFDCLLRRQLVS
jgi:lysophospholipase L1-like esterase